MRRLIYQPEVHEDCARSVHGKATDLREMVTVKACGNAWSKVLLAHLILIPGEIEKKLNGYDLESIDCQSPLKGANFSVLESGWTEKW